jgi:WD40 repeat protein/serine/threonine protein kinase
MTAEGRDPVDLFDSTEREAIDPDQPAAQAIRDPGQTASLPPGALATPEAATADTKSLPQLPTQTKTWTPQPVIPAVSAPSGAELAAAELTRDWAPRAAIPATTPDSTPNDSPSGISVELPGYEILGVLGRGGMGVVYKARQRYLDRTVALKMVLSGGHASQKELRRFCTEAQAIARLQHRNIVQIYEVGEHQGLPYFSLEYCAGGSLAGHLDGTPLPPKQAAELVELLSRAMHVAHLAGIVHRDLKPANILLASPTGDSAENAERKTATADSTKPSVSQPSRPAPAATPRTVLAGSPALVGWVPKITDFGLAKKLDDEAGPTVSGAIMGTPSYMAPEQASGRIHDICPATDVYALGAILYELVTGRPPFKGTTMFATLEQVRNLEPVAPGQLLPSLAGDLETVCLKCLNKEAARRYETAEELADDLHRFIANEAIRARPTPLWERAWKWAKRRPALAGLSAALLAVTVLGFSLVTWQWMRAEAASSDAQARAEAERIAKEKEGKARREADAKRLEAQRTTVSLLLEKGIGLCELGLYGPGLLWLVHALELTAPEADDQRDSLRRLLGGWADQLCTVQAVFPHDRRVLTLAVSPDGQVLLTGGRDGTAKLWDIATGKPLGAPLPLDRHVFAVAFSPNGKLFATAGADRKVTVWDRATRQQVVKPLIHPDSVLAVAFSPDSGRLLTGCSDNAARVWDLATGMSIGEPIAHAQSVTAVSFSANGKLLLTAGAEGDVQVRDADSGKPQPGSPWHHPAGVLALALSSDGVTALTGCNDGRARFWEVATGRQLDELPPQNSPITSVALNPKDQTVLAGTQAGAALLWDTSARKLVGTPLRHHGVLNRVVFGPDGGTVFTASSDETARQWQLPRLPVLSEPLPHPRGLWTLAFSPDSKMFATAGSDGNVRLWGATTGLQTGPILGHNGRVFTLMFHPDSTTLLAGVTNGTVCLWQAATGKQLCQPLRHPCDVVSAVFSPDGGTVLTAGTDGNARRWRTDTGKLVGEPMRHDGIIAFAVYSPDGQFILTGSFDQKARLWEASTGKPVSEPLSHDGPVVRGVFSRDGHAFLTIAGTGVRVWETAQALVRGQPLWHDDQAKAGEFSPDGLTVLTAGSDQTARLRLTATGEARGQPLAHQADIQEVRFSPDGRTALTRGGNLLRLWASDTGQPLGEAARHQGAIHLGLFSPDGRVVLTAAEDQTARLWEAATGKPLGPPLRHGNQGFLFGGFRPDGRAVLLGGVAGSARLWRVPKPLTSEIELLKLWIQICCGEELDAAGVILPLNQPTWEERFDQLRKRGALPRP